MLHPIFYEIMYDGAFNSFDEARRNYENSFIRDKEKAQIQLKIEERWLRHTTTDYLWKMSQVYNNVSFREMLEMFIYENEINKPALYKSYSAIIENANYTRGFASDIRKGVRRFGFNHALFLIFGFRLHILTAETWLNKACFAFSNDDDFLVSLKEKIINKNYVLTIDEIIKIRDYNMSAWVK